MFVLKLKASIGAVWSYATILLIPTEISLNTLDVTHCEFLNEGIFTTPNR